MAFILKKMMKTWESNKDSLLGATEHPTEPPSPDLSHLNREEISVINDVIRRQEMFERAEADRVRKIQDELEGLQKQLVERSKDGPHQQKAIDLRLCRLCFKNKFADGVGRMCHDCQQRVCAQCGSFAKPRWNSKKNKAVRGRWQCKLCTARREALCRTGGWYHGHRDSPDAALGLRKKLSPSNDQDTDAGSSTCRGNGTTNMEDSEAYPSGNRSDSELIHKSAGLRNGNNRRRSSVMTYRRLSLSTDAWNSIDRSSGGRGSYEDGGSRRRVGLEEDDDDLDSFDSLILERKLSRRRRQEKRQRRRFRNGNDKVPEEESSLELELSNTESISDSVQSHPRMVKSSSGQQHPTEGKPSDSTISHSRSLTLEVPGNVASSDLMGSKGSLRDSSVTETSSMLSFVDNSISDASTTSPVPPTAALRIIRQDAISLGSSCVSIASTTGDGSSRRGDSSTYSLEPSERVVLGRTREINGVNGVQSSLVRDNKVPVTKSGEAGAISTVAETAAKWNNKGFKDSYVVTVQSQSKDPPYSLQVTGGSLDGNSRALSVITWVSSIVKANVIEGHEVLEWNHESLRGKTYDQVVMLTSCLYPNVMLVLNPLQTTDTGDLLAENSVPECTPSRTSSYDGHGRPNKRRMLPRTPVEMKRAARHVKGELQIKLSYNPAYASLAVTIAGSRRLGIPDRDGHIAPYPYVIVHIVPHRCERETVETELRAFDGHPELAQTFVFDGFSLCELMSKSVALCLWNCDDRGDIFMGEVLLDLVDADLTDKPVWYQLQDYDENSTPLPTRGHVRSTSMSESLTSGSFHLVSPTVSPEVPSYRHAHASPSSLVSTTSSPVPFSRVGSREFHLNSACQPDSFTTKVRKKMRNTVNKMSSLSMSEKKDCSDDNSTVNENQRQPGKNDRGSASRSPNILKRRQYSRECSREYNSPNLLAPPKSLSRTNSTSSFFMSEDENSSRGLSISPATPDRPPPEGDDITSILGPGQIPPKPSAETSVCGDIKLAFMVSKGQLEVDILCAAGLHKSGTQQAPDTYVKTYLVEGKKVIQRKKTLIVKSSFDPVFRKKIKYSACNVHGRIMKIDVWEKGGSFEKKVCLGEVLVKLDGLDLSLHTMAWYKLFQINATDYGSDEFLSSW